MLMTSLDRDADALGSIKVEVEEGLAVYRERKSHPTITRHQEDKLRQEKVQD